MPNTASSSVPPSSAAGSARGGDHDLGDLGAAGGLRAHIARQRGRGREQVEAGAQGGGGEDVPATSASCHRLHEAHLPCSTKGCLDATD
jgi:hypothetical protein